MGLVVAMSAGAGVHLVYRAVVMGERSFAGSSVGAVRSPGLGDRVRSALAQAGLGDARPRDLVVLSGAAGATGAVAGLVVFGALVPAVALAVGAALWPAASVRARRAEMRSAAQAAWPALIDEIRILIGYAGRSVPQALFEVGRRAPEGMRSAFDAAQREWLLSTDFERTLAVLKDRLADPAADAVCETLLVAHEVGGTDVDRRLEALVEDRVLDAQGRLDARSRQEGVRFARRFVLLVPFGMVLMGMSLGTGRAAYGTAWGQTMVALGIATVAGCWVWAGRLLALPEEERVFAATGGGGWRR